MRRWRCLFSAEEEHYCVLCTVLTPFKVYVSSIYLYIIHTVRLKKSGSDYPLCKPFLKNTICYVKSEKKKKTGGNSCEIESVLQLII